MLGTNHPLSLCLLSVMNTTICRNVSVTIDREHTEASIDRGNLYSKAKLELVRLVRGAFECVTGRNSLSKACSRVILVRGVLEYRCLVVTNAFIGIPLHRVAVLVYVFKRVGQLLLYPLRR